MKLKDVCTKGTSNIAQKDLDSHNGCYPIFGASGFIKNVDFYHQQKQYIAIVKDGAGVGRVMRLPAKSSIIGTMQYIIPNEGVSVEYLAYALEHMNLSKYCLGAAIPHIYFKDYSNEPLPNHTAKEQANISHTLGMISKLILLRKQQLSKLDELVKSRFVELIEDGESPIKSVEELCSAIVDCPHTTPKYEGELKNPAIRTAEIKKGYIEWETMRYVSDEEYEERTARLKPEAGDIVYGREGTFGNAAILPKGHNFCLGQRVMLLRPDYSKCTSEYLLYAVISDDVYRQALEKNNASTVAHVNVKDVKLFRIPLPSFDKQYQFATFVEQTDKSKFEIQKSLEKLETLKKALMQKYFG